MVLPRLREDGDGMKDCCTINKDLLHLMDKPSIVSHNCPICNAKATDQHHIVPRSAGRWVEGGIEHNKPTVSLCHKCHIELVHSERRLFFDWDDGWMYLKLPRTRVRQELERHPEWGGKIGYQNARQLSGWRRLV